MLSVLLGCPSYDDEHSGTFVEVRQDALSEEIIAIDFFRFGYYSNAIVRRYRAPQSASPDALLDNPISCNWTDTGDAPDDANTWRLNFEQNTKLQGVFSGPDTLSLTIEEPDESGTVSTTTKTLRRFRDRPNNACTVIRPLLLQASFNLNGATTNALPEESGYALRQPTFAMLWTGITPKRQGNTIVGAAKNDLVNEIPLTAQHFKREERELAGALSFAMNPPDDRMLTRSGDTSYALAHFIVIDDACQNDGCTIDPDANFRWDIDEEPIIATSLQRGNEVDSPVPSATGLGKALLFVEGSLDDLGPDIQALMYNRDAYEGRRARAHFYVVDIFFKDEGDVLGIRLPENPEFLSRQDYRSATLKMSNTYLTSTQIQLPRIPPVTLE